MSVIAYQSPKPPIYRITGSYAQRRQTTVGLQQRIVQAEAQPHVLIATFSRGNEKVELKGQPHAECGPWNRSSLDAGARGLRVSWVFETVHATGTAARGAVWDGAAEGY